MKKQKRSSLESILIEKYNLTDFDAALFKKLVRLLYAEGPGADTSYDRLADEAKERYLQLPDNGDYDSLGNVTLADVLMEYVRIQQFVSRTAKNLVSED